MKIKIQTIDCSVSESLEAHIKKVVSKLNTKYTWIEATNFVIKAESHDKDQNIVVEIRMAIPGNDLFCDTRDEKMELAVNRGLDKMSRLLDTKKNKDFSHSKRTPL